MTENKRAVVNGECYGHTLIVYVSMRKRGYEIVMEKDGKVRGEKFVPWTYAPVFEIDVVDKRKMGKALDILLRELDRMEK